MYTEPMLTRRSALGLLLAASTATFAACAAPAAGGPSETLDAAGFAALVAKPGTVVVDVRTPAEFADGHLENALNLDVQGTDFGRQISALDKAATYAVYCRSGNRSATALKLMKQVGIANAYHLGGGIGAWQEAGYPVVR